MNLKRALTAVASAVMIMGSFAVGNFAFAIGSSGAFTNAQENLNMAAGGTKGATTQDLPTLVSKIINIALGFLGILLFLYFFYGGFLWMTAGGDAKKVDAAKTMLKNATIGLVIILASWSISAFVLNSLIGATS